MKGSPYKSLPTKKLPRSERQLALLFGLIELYLKTGKAIGSHTLQESDLVSLSSATIRNDLSQMEEEGLLKQQHTSGGRVPTEKAIRLFVASCTGKGIVDKEQEKALKEALQSEKGEVASTLAKAAETLSNLTQTAVFMTTPRFDQDFIQDVRLIALADREILVVVITNFGLVKTERLYLEKTASSPFLKTTEAYFLWRLSKAEKPFFEHESEARLAQRLYNEVMVRHVVGYANYSEQEIVTTGLSKLLAYPEFSDTASLATGLSLFENEIAMRQIAEACAKKGKLSVWIGDELCPTVPAGAECAIVAIPYRINHVIAGVVALLGPMRLPYRSLFGLLELFHDEANRVLSHTLQKHQITFRAPTEPKKMSILLENQTT
ncbi:MAG: heat-inducible transcription repressor hrcA [Chlamydiota bacterium]|jgi:heat-inducible transcriptional repressor